MIKLKLPAQEQLSQSRWFEKNRALFLLFLELKTDDRLIPKDCVRGDRLP